ncbi:hypothetical protein AJ88_20760 [Mesorhizobium amorphae CCBAU 01583]|nr:hypothetical protein AJ88_20760 [Mesorhizobium amorphae CCBAU 01583]
MALNKGLVGVGNSGSKGTVDNFRVQVLPPQITLDYAAEFDAPPTYPMSKTSAQGWTLSGGRLNAAAGAGTNLLDVGPAIGTDAYLELTAKLKTAGTGGIVFDYYGANDYKFVTLDVVGQKVLVGHVTSKGGTAIDQSFVRTLSSTTDYEVQLTIRGAALSITINGAFVGSYGFNAAIADGEFGLVTGNAGASFDRLQIRTNASAFSTSSNQLALASLARRRHGNDGRHRSDQGDAGAGDGDLVGQRPTRRCTACKAVEPGCTDRRSAWLGAGTVGVRRGADRPQRGRTWLVR